MSDSLTAKEALKNLWNPKAETKQKGRAVQDRPGVARVTEVIRALIPLIILGLVLLILHFAAPSAFNWVISYGSLGAKLTGSLIPAAIALLTIGIGVGNRVKHNHYLYSFKNETNSEDLYSFKNETNSEDLYSFKNETNSEDLDSFKNKTNSEAKDNEEKSNVQKYLKFIANKVVVPIPSTTYENARERELTIDCYCKNDPIGVVKVNIQLSNVTLISKVKYLIAEYFEVITKTSSDVSIPDMKICLDKKTDVEILNDDSEIGEITNIRLVIEN